MAQAALAVLVVAQPLTTKKVAVAALVVIRVMGALAVLTMDAALVEVMVQAVAAVAEPLAVVIFLVVMAGALVS
jgi:hypothetical protein